MILLIAIRLYVAQITNVALFTGKEVRYSYIQYKENKCVLDKK